MGDYATLLKIITDYFREYKAYDLPDVCKKYGIECDSNLEPMASKLLMSFSFTRETSSLL